MGRVQTACLGLLGLLGLLACADGPESVSSHFPPPPPPPPNWRPGYYAAPGGLSSGAGTPTQPWDLSTALAGGHGSVQPGDTVWLRGGTYTGHFVSSLTGTSAARVVVRGYPGERAVVNGAGTASNISVLLVDGDWSEFRDFELTDADPVRTTPRPDVVANYGSHTRYLNLVIHDGGVAFYSENTTADVEIAGCVIFDNGWQGTDRGHGHAVYVKSDAGPVWVHDNVLFNQFGFGIHAYSDSGTGDINGVHFQRNVVFNNGAIAADPTESGNILVGGEAPADGAVLDSNIAYYTPGVPASNVRLGWINTLNGSIAVSRNYFVGGDTLLDVGFWRSAMVSLNTLIGGNIVEYIRDSTTTGAQWADNSYNRDPLDSAWGFFGLTYPFAVWKALTGLGVSDVADSVALTGPRVFVLRNSADSARTVVAVFNWGRWPSVPVDLSAALVPGDSFEVRNVQTLWAAPLQAGVYAGGSVGLAETGVPPPVPVGLAASPAPRTGPDFDVFLVNRVAPDSAATASSVARTPGTPGPIRAAPPP